MKHFLTIILLATSGHYVLCQTSPVFSPDGIAIKGYDAVAYFLDGEPVKGVKEFSHSWQGAEWCFKNQTNLDIFKADPEKYTPQFGGYCAYGASENHKSPTEPAAFTIVNNKLYLNYNQKVKELWIKDTIQNIKKAEINWITLKTKE